MRRKVPREEYEAEAKEIETLSAEVARLEGEVSRLARFEAEARADYRRVRHEADVAGRRVAETEGILRSERARFAAFHRWAEFYRGLKSWRRVGLYRRLIAETADRISNLERSIAWWEGRVRTLDAEAGRIAGLIDRRLRERLAAERELGRKRRELERLKKEFEEKVVPPPAVWEYKLRVSARVVRGFAPGRARRAATFPPRWVDLTIELAVELAGLPEEERRKKILGELDRLREAGEIKKLREIGVGKSPIFVELFFESFISRLDFEELEAEYRDKLTELIKQRGPEIARYCNMVEVVLDEFDFGIETRRPIDYTEETSSDFWEIWTYPPSGYAQLVDDGRYEHPV